MDSRRMDGLTILISFSGIDGAGKSTQIKALRESFEQMGLRVQLITFWDDVAALTRFRESAGHVIFKGEKGVGSPEAPVARRDKNVRSPFMTCVRYFLYLLDALSLRSVARKAQRSNFDVAIFDRFHYDELANLNLGNPFTRVYIRLLVKIVPKPAISYFLDADPITARARKPEYPLDFLHMNRQCYLDLCQLLGAVTVIAPGAVDEVKEAILTRALYVIPISEVRPDASSSPASMDRVDADRMDKQRTHPAIL